jgi:ESS family glutamate:Na+ symporter
MLDLALVPTLAVAALVLVAGHRLQRAVPVLARANIPAPVVGGLVVALAVTVARAFVDDPVRFDTSLQTPLMIAFFTSIGFGASLTLLRRGGPAMLLLLALATAGGVVQNLVGGGVAALLGHSPLLGVLAGSLTLTGGPATGLAFAPLFEKAGLGGAATLATAAAMAGIVSSGLLGNPLGTWLIERRGLRPESASPAPSPRADAAPEPPPAAGAGLLPRLAPGTGPALVRALAVLLVAMWAGSWLSAGIEAAGVTLPAYVGAMIVAALLRNLDELTGWLSLDAALLEDVGHVALSFFLALALMTLRLWELRGLALPLLVILVVQVAIMVPMCLGPVFRWMGRDYESAVATSGFCGFMLGITANAMANMDALVERYGPAPRAFLVVPLVGAFFIDFTNALVLTVFLNFWG